LLLHCSDHFDLLYYSEMALLPAHDSLKRIDALKETKIYERDTIYNREMAAIVLEEAYKKILAENFDMSSWNLQKITKKDEDRLWRSCYFPNDITRVVQKGFSIILTVKEFNRLLMYFVVKDDTSRETHPAGWINDELINYWGELIMERERLLHATDIQIPKCYFFNSFFLVNLVKDGYDRVKRWTTQADIFKVDKVLVPYHSGAHWTTYVVDTSSHAILYYDSLGAKDDADVTKKLCDYLNREWERINPDVCTPNWRLRIEKTPKQKGGIDCGVFCMKVMDCIAQGISINFTANHIGDLRRRMALQLLDNSLLQSE